MMQKNHLLLSILVVTFCMLFITVIGCDSNNEGSTEQIESEEIVEPESEDVIIEQEPETEEIAEDVSGEDELEPEIKVVVNVDILRLRSGPGTDYEILDRLRLGTILEVIGEKDEWLQVTRREGWVHGDYVSKPEDPEKLYEVLPVKVQPVGYTKEQVTSFIEKSTSYICSDFVLPEFNQPNNMSDNELVIAIINSPLMIYYYEPRGAKYTVKDLQETGRAIFGRDLRDIELFGDLEILNGEGRGCGSYTKTRVLNIVEKEKEFFVDVVHLIYYYSPYEEDFNYLASEVSRHSEYDSDYEGWEAFLENNLDLLVNTEEMIEKHIKTFPVRRYILSKEGDGILYIRQSILLDD